MKLPIVTIDGPAGVGKSTVARRVADDLAIPYLDTGAMFRHLAFILGKGALQMPNSELSEKCGQCDFVLEGAGSHTRLLCNGRPGGSELRTEAIGALASTLATKPEVRQFMRRIQQSLGARAPLVAEGRDMGTEIFPAASFKFFLDASPEIRARRRWLQLKEQGQNVPLDELERNIRERDFRDRNRAVAPLRPAPDACIIDTSKMNADSVLALILASIGQAGGRQQFHHS